MWGGRAWLSNVFRRRERYPKEHFSAALGLGRRLTSLHFSAVLPPEGQGYAVVVSKKVARLSVTRHRLKRVVLEALRTLPLPKALIVFPKATAARLDTLHLHADLAALLGGASQNGRNQAK